MVFWRDIGWKEEEEAVEARDGVCNMMDIVCLLQFKITRVQACMPKVPDNKQQLRRCRAKSFRK